jgi:hypothetical protein
VIARAEASLGLADDEVAPVVDWNLARLRVAAADRAALAGPDHVGPAGPAEGDG